MIGKPPLTFDQLLDETLLNETIAALAKANEEVDQGRAVIDALVALFPEIVLPASCPACDSRDMLVWQAVAHFNDYHLWSREKIAEWLDALP